MSTHPHALLVLRRAERDSIAAVPMGVAFWFVYSRPDDDDAWYVAQSEEADAPDAAAAEADLGEYVGEGDVAEAEALLTVIRRNREAAAAAGVTVEEGGIAG